MGGGGGGFQTVDPKTERSFPKGLKRENTKELCRVTTMAKTYFTYLKSS